MRLNNTRNTNNKCLLFVSEPASSGPPHMAAYFQKVSVPVYAAPPLWNQTLFTSQAVPPLPYRGPPFRVQHMTSKWDTNQQTLKSWCIDCGIKNSGCAFWPVCKHLLPLQVPGSTCSEWSTTGTPNEYLCSHNKWYCFPGKWYRCTCGPGVSGAVTLWKLLWL